MKISNNAGLTVEFLGNGAVSCIYTDTIMISLRRATVYTGAYAGIWLRKRNDTIENHLLTAPGSEGFFRVENGIYSAAGNWEGIGYICSLRLSEKSLSWEWATELFNNSGREVTLDLVCLQDAGLKTISHELVNEYYVSQYTERRIFDDSVSGKVVCCRQNMKESGGWPWLMMASLGRSGSASTDGMQFYGKSYRATGIPEGLLAESLGGEYAGESSVIAVQEEPFVLGPGKTRRVRFVLTFLHNHPQATSEADLDRLHDLAMEFSHNCSVPAGGLSSEALFSLLHKPGGLSGIEGFRKPELNLFSDPVILQADELSEKEIEKFFPGPRRHTEFSGGQPLSFFYDMNRHVMLREKELLVDRPHGHIMHTRSHLVPDESIMSTTAFASGVFNSHLTQGNTNFNTLLSVCNSQFNINPVSGQRIFVVAGSERMLLGVPSAFEMGLNHCRWLYRHGSSLYQVRTWTSGKVPQVNMDFRVLEGDAVALVVTHDFDRLNGWSTKPGDVAGEYVALPATGSMISRKFPDARYRINIHCSGSRYSAGGNGLSGNDGGLNGNSLFSVETDQLTRFGMSFTGCVTEGIEPLSFDDADRMFASDAGDATEEWKEISRSLSIRSNNDDISAITEILPWFGMNAVTHFLTPYGLEQFSGAAWGTRDVSQGPVELLLATGKYDEARKVLTLIFSNQEPDGGWPQWWMFDSYNEIRADSAHGDIVYWCLIALSSYIRATGDFGILDERLPYFQKDEKEQKLLTPLREHINRLVDKVTGSFIRGKWLVRYGGGDWNDSLQPVNRELAERLISSWMVEMNYQAFREYAEVCAMAGHHALAEEMNRYSENIRSDFNRYLVSDGVVAGYGLAGDDGRISLLLHPSDTVTGISYSLLPMERGIVSGIFTPEQAATHLELIRRHLTGPDGARLMDRPLRYSGGTGKIFRRAESSTFFGREIGLMYLHEHIRYAESLARTGRAVEFMKALRQAIPAGYAEIVPCSDTRQSNCYYSSSDAVFETRYQADERYNEIIEGKITLRGGWRVYSSGPGIFAGLIMTHLLGIRREWGRFVIDPVMPASLDGIEASLIIMGRTVTFVYHVIEGCSGPKRITVNGRDVAFTPVENQYRPCGAAVDESLFEGMLPGSENRVDIYL
ncbi:MAG TPA: amylo-alpha-1,6-glucosidase [Bacteroidales bacterium]|nr:amylo-alpha-1,6-glucosidase [Bacteroidales bacterium]